MADDRKKPRQSARIAHSEDQEVNAFALQHGVTAQQALEIIAKARDNLQGTDQIAPKAPSLRSTRASKAANGVGG